MAGIKLVCFVSIVLGASSFVLTQEPPTLQSFGFPNDIVLGASVQVFCNLNKGKPPVTFIWTKDGQAINEAEGIKTGLFNDRSSFLVIENVAADKMGNYTCTVKNTNGADSHTALLVIPVL
ncbi:junctional adhesion molecule A-like isoform X4 [Tachypleus tridentatus]|uniref:junctional adhesion molecule A-like isoform X4 n=1 Tax=Tachypleus tridentatus TaxID=6853 RepID=UPI003FD2ACFE